MPIAGIRVLTVGTRIPLPYEVLHLDSTASVLSEVARWKPDIIVTVGWLPGQLQLAAFEVRRRWIHCEEGTRPDQIMGQVEACHYQNLFFEHRNRAQNPIVSVYTASWNSGDYLEETLRSLKEQTYSNWEWVVVDDHSNDGTWERLERMACEDPRIRPFRMGAKSGRIGEMKDTATKLCRGAYLVELDHDDMLTDGCLLAVKEAFEADPEVGMVYSNCSAFYENGTFQRFDGPDWTDRYRWTEYRGKKYLERITPDIYDGFGPDHPQRFAWFLTMGPDHVRAYRATTLKDVGGYNPNLPVVDDWDLFVRFFMRSKCVHIDRMLYLYRVRDNWGNATFAKNKMIQDHLHLARHRWTQEFQDVNAKRLAGERTASGEKVVPEGATPADVSFVVLQAVENPYVKKCLESIRTFSSGSEIILVGNGVRPPGDVEELADKVLLFEENLRFSAGSNAGAQAATRKILCFLNDDAEFVDAQTVPKMLGAMTDETPIVGPYSNRAKPPQGDIEKAPEEGRRVHMVVGLCMMMPAEIFRRLGGFDPRLFTWDDDDFCTRAAKLGFGVRIAGGAFVLHERHASFKAMGQDVNRVMMENRVIFTRKHPRIKVVVIAKDEEAGIRQFFEQFRPVTLDWCLLDTGSTDRTVEVARSIGVRIEYGSLEDFAQARNLALDRFARAADWVIMFDPDERLDGRTILGMNDLVANAAHDIYLAPLKAKYTDGSEKQFVAKPFLFRSRPHIRWAFKVHEKLVGSAKQALVQNGMITHMIALHEDGRRQKVEGFYKGLMDSEPYFTDPVYKKQMRDTWPILDYDRMDDSRISKVQVGPLVSVVIPTFKRKELLRRAVGSALAQDWTNLEVVIVGDACPELDPAEYASEPRVRVFNLKTNHGAGGAEPRNHAIRMAAGEWIAYLDDDNVWKSDHVSSVMAEIGTKASIGFSSMEVGGKDLKFAEPKQGGIDTSCAIHRKNLVAKYGGWKNRDEGGYAHDWEFFNRIFTGGEPWACTRRPTLMYNADTCGQREFLKKMVAAL